MVYLNTPFHSVVEVDSSSSICAFELSSTSEAYAVYIVRRQLVTTLGKFIIS